MLNRGPALVVAVAVAAFVGGILLLVVTHLVANSNIQGDGWSLRGNGALVVPFGLGPQLIGAGVGALILRYRRSVSWAAWGLVFLVIGTGLVLLSVGALIVTRSPAALAVLQVPVFAWPIAAVVLAALIKTPRSDQSSDAWNLVSTPVLVVAIAVGFFAGEQVLPT